MQSALLALLLAPSFLLRAEAKPSATVKVGTGIENRDVTGEAATLQLAADSGEWTAKVLGPDLGVGPHHLDEERRGREAEALGLVARGFRGAAGDAFLEEPLQGIELGASVSSPAGFDRTIVVLSRSRSVTLRA